jgi:hypothetical protein
MPHSEFVQQIDDMARDFAAILHGGHTQSDRRVGMAWEGSGSSGKSHTLETLSVRRNDRFAGDGSSIRRPKSRAPGGFFTAAQSKATTSFERLRSVLHLKKLDFSFRTLAFTAVPIVVAATLAWQSHGVSMTKSPNVNVAGGQTVSAFANKVPAQDPPQQSAVVIQTAPAPASAGATVPEVVQQLGNIVRDLAILRDSVQQLAAKQEQTAQIVVRLQAVVAKQDQTAQTLQEVAAKQEQTAQTLQELATKQAQMAQNIAMLQAGAETEQEDIRPKLSSPPSSKAAPPPRPKKPPLAASKQSTAQSASAPRLAPVRLPFLDASPE